MKHRPAGTSLSRTAGIAVWIVVTAAASAQAGVMISQSSVATPGMATHMTHTLTASTDDGSNILGFDFLSQPTFGFFGPFNQVNPFGLPTIFEDNNAAIQGSGANVLQDTQFKYPSNIFTIPSIPGNPAVESNMALRQIFASGAPGGLGTSTSFVQLVVPIVSGNISFLGDIQTQLGSANPVDNRVSGNSFCCVPPTIIDAFIDNVNANEPGFVNHHLVVLLGVLDSFQFDSYEPAAGVTGTGPAIPAMLDLPTQEFTWNTVGSPLGTYKWAVTASNIHGTSNGSITVRITVPEPATIALLGLALAGCFGFIRRR